MARNRHLGPPVTMTVAARGATRFQRLTAEDLGFNRLARSLLVFHLVLLAFAAVVCQITGLLPGGGPGTWLAHATPPLMLLFLWTVLYAQPDRTDAGRWTAEGVLGLALLLTGTSILAPLQYVAASADRPLVDSSLAAADAWMGVHVPSIVAWTRAHPALDRLLVLAYHSLVPQFLIAVLAVWWSRDRQALWEYIVMYHVCAVATIASSALWPAAGVFTHFGFSSTLDQTRFIDHFQRLRDGTMTAIPMGDIEGLISVPSFHVIGGLLLTWAVRRTPLVWPVGLLNAFLIASTVMTGAHYAIDVPAALLTWGAALVAYRVWLARLVPASRAEAAASGVPILAGSRADR